MLGSRAPISLALTAQPNTALSKRAAAMPWAALWRDRSDDARRNRGGLPLPFPDPAWRGSGARSWQAQTGGFQRGLTASELDSVGWRL